MKKIRVLLILVLSVLVNSTACNKQNTAPQPDTPKVEQNSQQLQLEGGLPQLTTPGPQPSNTNIMGSFETEILDKEKNRISNIELAIDKIDGYILQPGQVFSFNDVVGKRDTKRGFKKATIIFRKKRAKGTGGGICQVSSTLYNAVKRSNLEVVERHSHSKDVHYVPLGQDATVVYGQQDFKFKNNTDYPIKVNASINSSTVAVSIEKA